MRDILRKKLKRILFTGALLLIGINTLAQVSVSWEPPLLPIKVSYSRNNGISFSVSPSIRTPIGKFSLEYTHNFSEQRKNSSTVYYANREIVRQQDLLVVIRDRNSYGMEDDVHRIKNGSSLEVEMEGRTNITISNGLVIIDITNIDDFTFTLNAPKSSIISQVSAMLLNYYDHLKNNRFENLRAMFGINVKRFYNLYNIHRNVVVDDNIRKYDTMFGVYGKRFDIRWQTLNVIQNNTGYQVTYQIDYSIDRYDTTKPSRFLIQMFIEMNSNLQIISIYENILRKD